jgi:hypothetical protein
MMDRVLRGTIAVVAALASIALVAGPASADQSFAHLRNPVANIRAVPSLTASGECTHSATGWSCLNPCVNSSMKWAPGNNTRACAVYTLRAINHARRVLAEPALSLPSNWYSLSEDEQLFTIVDAERVTLGYPAYLGINAKLSAEATVAARQSRDPAPAPGFSFGYNPSGYEGVAGTWASAYNALEADYGWMYEDGWGGSRATTSNIDCTTRASLGCWGHRDALLGSSSFNPAEGVGLGCTNCEVGTGFAIVRQDGSEVVLIERPAGAAPAMTFTWAHELGYFHGTLHRAKAPAGPATTSLPAPTTSTSPPTT